MTIGLYVGSCNFCLSSSHIAPDLLRECFLIPFTATIKSVTTESTEFTEILKVFLRVLCVLCGEKSLKKLSLIEIRQHFQLHFVWLGTNS